MKPRLAFAVILLLHGLVAVSSVHASEKLLFGHEFTFHPPADVARDDWFRDEVYPRIFEGFRARGERRRISRFIPSRGFTIDGYRRDIWAEGFHFFTDPEVVEVTGKPKALGEYEAQKDQYQDLVFGNLVGAGGRADFENGVGGGHITVDLGYFRARPRVYRDLVVDLVSHSELAQGVWKRDALNAKSFPELPEERQRAFLAIVESFDGDPERDLDRFQAELRQWEESLPEGAKSFMLSFRPDRLELRSVRPQRTMNDFLSYLRILEGRVGFLEQNPGRSLPRVGIQVESAPDAHIESYSRFTREAGVGWREARRLLPAPYLKRARTRIFR